MGELLVHELKHLLGIPATACTVEDVAREPGRVAGRADPRASLSRGGGGRAFAGGVGGGRHPGSRRARPPGGRGSPRGQHRLVPVAFAHGAALRVRLPAQPPRRRDPGRDPAPGHAARMEASREGGGPRADGRPLHGGRTRGGGPPRARGARGAALRPRAAPGRPHHRGPARRASRRRRRSPPALLTAAWCRWAGAGIALCVVAPAAPSVGAPEPSINPSVVIVYGGDATFAPYEYLDGHGEPHGFNVELIRALGREAGVGIDVRLRDWWTVLRDLDAGRVDLVSLRLTEERARRHDLVAQTWTFQQEVVFADHGHAPRTIEELAGVRIAVSPGTLTFTLLTEL